MLDVLCSFRKSEKVFGIMDRCLKCRHYHAFLREMAEQDEKVMDEIDQIQRYGYPVSFCSVCGRRLDSQNCSDVANTCSRCSGKVVR